MATKHRYEFECGHAANATNQQALGNVVHFTSVGEGGNVTQLDRRGCPRCMDRIEKHIVKILFSKKRVKPVGPLPLPGKETATDE